jgi:hypothetical protein
MSARAVHLSLVFSALLLLGMCANAFSSQQDPEVDLGWIRVTQSANGWRVVRVYNPLQSSITLQPNDIILAVDDFRVSGLSALSTARLLNRVVLNAHSITLTRNGSTAVLPLHRAAEPLAKFVFMEEANTNEIALYKENDHLPTLTLQDANGQKHVLQFTRNWTLIHIWNTGCDPHEVAALNEIANPSPEALNVVGIAMNDTAGSVRQFVSSREKIDFLNLLGGSYDGDFARQFDYFALRTDILIDPAGHVAFVGSGPNALRQAWIQFRKEVE